MVDASVADARGVADVNVFCVNDMSAYYFSIAKDRLYCGDRVALNSAAVRVASESLVEWCNVCVCEHGASARVQALFESCCSAFWM